MWKKFLSLFISKVGQEKFSYTRERVNGQFGCTSYSRKVLLAFKETCGLYKKWCVIESQINCPI